MRFPHFLCFLLLFLSACMRIPGDPEPAAEEEPAAQNQAEAAPAAPAQPTFSQLEWKLVDKRKALADNPGLIEAENKVKITDPITGPLQAYIPIASKINLMNFQHNLDILKAIDDRNPSFDEFNRMFKEAGVQLKGLYPWQVYAYDDQEGTICILEDPAEKKRLYNEQGMEPPE
ncbi:MAG: hypothetical protein KDA88_16525 [Planctomycetaceae bacterium]|nr:hypothetical protein [Planctomycetaceae bacterium]MCB9953279.1 hypothetical protein [Planctomycetaceae bacterium]